MAKPRLPSAYGEVHTGIVEQLESARRAAARSVNALMTASYWEVGRRSVEFEQGGKGRTKSGEALVERLAEDLTHRFGRGFSRQNLWQMRALHLAWPVKQIAQTLSAQSSPPRISQTASGESQSGHLIQTPSGLLPDLAMLATLVPLPWSAYVRLLAVKSEARRFRHADAVQMRLYLNYAREHWMKPGENPPVGHPLCRQGRGRGPLRPRQSDQQGARRRIPDRTPRREADRRGTSAVAAGTGDTAAGQARDGGQA